MCMQLSNLKVYFPLKLKYISTHARHSINKKTRAKVLTDTLILLHNLNNSLMQEKSHFLTY